MSTAVIGAPGFRARSGRIVQVRDNGTVTFDHANGYLSPETAMDAEEFFQHQRDLELGRWRWPQNPDYVVMDAGLGFAKILHEPSMETTTWERGWRDTRSISDEAGVAYFEAHPQRPAAEAKIGEVWELTLDDGSEHTVFVHADRTMGGRDGVSSGGAYFDLDDGTGIVSARKVWGPEDAS